MSLQLGLGLGIYRSTGVCDLLAVDRVLNLDMVTGRDYSMSSITNNTVSK